MRICVQAGSIFRSASGELVGSIWIEFAGHAYPCVLWSDFILRVLEQWASQYSAISSGDGVARLMVYDGPDRLRIERRRDAAFVRTEQSGDPIDNVILKADDLLALGETGIDCCRVIDEECSELLTEIESKRLAGVTASFRLNAW